MAQDLDYRAWRAARIESGPRGNAVNNTGNTRQVRRQRERQFEDAPLSPSTMELLARLRPGDGIFNRYRAGFGVSRSPGAAGETMPPRTDHSARYAHLFRVTEPAG